MLRIRLWSGSAEHGGEDTLGVGPREKAEGGEGGEGGEGYCVHGPNMRMTRCPATPGSSIFVDLIRRALNPL